jgi:predicted MPP superfamily phosphohydrolase
VSDGSWSLVYHDLHIVSIEDAHKVLKEIGQQIVSYESQKVSIANMIFGGDVIQGWGNKEAAYILHYFLKALKNQIPDRITISCVLGNHDWAGLCELNDPKVLGVNPYNTAKVKEVVRALTEKGIIVCVDTIITNNNVSLIPDASYILDYPPVFVREVEPYARALAATGCFGDQKLGTLAVGHNPDISGILPVSNNGNLLTLFGHTHGYLGLRIPVMTSRLMTIGEHLVPERQGYNIVISAGSTNQRVPLLFKAPEFWLVRH